LNLASEPGHLATRTPSWTSAVRARTLREDREDREGVGDEGEEGDPNRGRKEQVGGSRQARADNKIRALENNPSLRSRGRNECVRGGGRGAAGRGAVDSETKTLQPQPPPFVPQWKVNYAESGEQGSAGIEVGVEPQLLPQTQPIGQVAAESLDSVRGRVSALQVEQARKPFKILKVGVQYRFTGNERRYASEQQQVLLAPVYIRIMGDPIAPIGYDNISFVAKDLCVLLQMPKSDVRRTVGEYGVNEKKILPVVCSHNDGTASIHMLLCLTPRGIRRLVTESTFHLAAQVSKWAFDLIEQMCGDGSK